MSIYEIFPLQTARTVRPMTNLTYLRNYSLNVEIYYGPFLLKGSDRNILVDTGCDARSYTFGGMPDIEDIASLDWNLKRFSLSKEKIDAVILTHMHFDHVAFLNMFTNCSIFVQEKELRSALHPHPYFAYLYVPDFFKDMKFELIDGEAELFSGIEVLPVPGHSLGTQAVIVETKEGRAAISGFCCTSENFNENNLSIPGIHENVQLAYDSLFRLMDSADIIFPNHSANYVKAARAFRSRA